MGKEASEESLLKLLRSLDNWLCYSSFFHYSIDFNYYYFPFILLNTLFLHVGGFSEIKNSFAISLVLFCISLVKVSILSFIYF